MIFQAFNPKNAPNLFKVIFPTNNNFTLKKYVITCLEHINELGKKYQSLGLGVICFTFY